MRQHSVAILNRSGPPKCPADPRYPNGKDIDMTGGAVKSCLVMLPYPAPERCVLLVKCALCTKSVALTAAGRTDDPRSVTFACHPRPDRR